ncbi:LOW QUALITY PROTEIN: snRNA-activating protein complex subunit 4 [Siniperca chuatsi]|uniref:LOW QUALITY PROTEIN: snRNA-activating protein complex subunit 4 n=1 Tax=Siniperca chuatsi TaxID=119488 RepID=UPI001CE104C5|nr:LOW QUALITY PROTEIN: snRNA-activating protein complex subunit 4 [Siniperca chuatsi]
MSVSLSAERDRIQREVEELEQSLSATQAELELLSSETGDESDGDDTEEEAGQSAAGLLAQREKIQKEIQNLENVLGPHSPISVSEDDDNSSDESELDLSLSVDSCLQMNLVYQQVVQATLDHLETLLTHNYRQQKEVLSQLSGPSKESSREQRPPPSSCQQPFNMFLGRFLKPYFKDKLTGLGPPANQETKEKANRMTGCLDNRKLKLKRWESWQKTLLIHSVARDSLRRLIQPKLSKVDYLSQKLSSAVETDKQQLRQQIDSLERDIDLLKGKKEEELIGDRYEEHDWQKISNIDFEGTRDAEDIRCFWQNFLHPSINKTRWSQEEVQQLEEVSRRHGERHWETIATELGTGRTAFLCLQTFQRFVSGSLKHGSWTPSEDAQLRELVDKMRIGNFIPYTQISYFMEGRDPAQVIYRWIQVLDPSLKKGPWTKQEDQLLLRAVSLHGEKSWWRIRLEVPGRTDSACRDRYFDCLKAETKRGPFDQQEKELLLQLVEKHGVGRWARIAAEIPNRNDAQCLREWRKLSRPTLPPPQKDNKAKKKQKSRRGEKKKKKKVNPAKKGIRRRLMKLKEEEEDEEEDEEEEEEMMVEYMDSDEEEKKNNKEVVEVERTEEVEKDEEEEEYIIPPMQEWTPTEKAQCFTFLNFRPVELPSSGDAHNGKPVRSTILGPFGRSVIIGPPPKELQWEKRHSSSIMLMLSPDQLRAHLKSSPRGKVQTGKKKHLGRVTDVALGYELQAAVTPWIGNLLIPAKTRLTAADVLREQREKTPLSSTPVFLLLLQTMNVDTVGCKRMIEQRRNRVAVTPPPYPSSARKYNLKNIAGLQQKKVKDILQELDMQHQLILKQLRDQQQAKQNQQQLWLKQQVRPQQLMLLQQPPRPLSLPSQNSPGVLLQMPPNVQTSRSPVSFPQAVFVPHPVVQPRGASVQLMPPSSLTTPPPVLLRPPSAGVVTSPLPALPAPHRLQVPPVSVLPVPLNATSTCSASFHRQAGPLTQNLIVALPSSPNQHVSIGSALPSQHAVASNSSSPVSCSSQNGVDLGGAGDGVDGACTGVDGAGVIKKGRTIRKMSQKPKALQEATDAKAETSKTNCTAPIQLVPLTPPSSMTTPPTSSQRPPPAGVISSPLTKTEAPSHAPPSAQETTPPALRLNVPGKSSPLPQNATPTCSDRTVSSTQNISLADSVQPSPAPKPTLCKSDSAPNKPPKALPRGRKRGRGEEQQSVTNSQGDQCVGRTGDAVGGTGTGVIQEGKRVRKPSQRARALQEASQEKAEAKKKRTSSPPSRKRSRTSRSKEEVVVQNQPVTQLPGFRLLPGQSMWVMTPGGLVQLAETQLQGLQVALVPSAPLPAPPGNILTGQPPLQLTTGSPRLIAPQPTAVSVPVNLPGLNQPRPLPAPPTCPSKPLPQPSCCNLSQPGSSSPSSCAFQPPPKLFLPYKGTVRGDPVAPSLLRKESLEFDPSLMFLESQAAVRDWLSGKGGVVVPGMGVALPYLPPFVSSLSTLSALLRAKKSLTRSSLELLSQGSEPRRPQTKPKTDSNTKTTSSRPPDLPDSTSELRPAADKPVPPVSSNLLQEEEAELVVAVRQLVAERFSNNPAYQMLKARFLSCFTVPAMLATVQPITKKTVTRPAEGEEQQQQEGEEQQEEGEEEELKKIKDRGRRRRAERSLLLSDSSGAPANHFSGITNTNTPTTDQPRPDQTGPDQ